ncbi:hypothetical protein [Sphingobacterium daejeonense]|uniref:hypothetical protein n=1 Tax=Sphingobacterium daejeonense TaxID=371142 RepID=UPI003D315059
MKLSLIFLTMFLCHFLLPCNGQNVLYNNVRIGLDAPALGVNILGNWPAINGSWVRGYSISNHNDSDRFVYFGTYGNILDGVTTAHYSFIGKTYINPFVTFLPNGNVGIGTNTPNVKLSVKGMIRAQEIKVEAANWPDYVFRPGHELMSLNDLEMYISQNHHLPGIPSAREIERNGVLVSDMIKKLLKKNEELTLHLIDRNKQIEKQGKVLDDLSFRIQVLEKSLRPINP